MPKDLDTHGCTCPSGDGSLRGPYPVHPSLLPCPFYGASARSYEIEPHQHSAALLALVAIMPKEHQGSYVVEGNCQCGPGLIGHNQAEVTARWSSRAQKPSLAQPADTLEPVRQAVREHHFALNTRQHGGVAADVAINSIETALDIRWKQCQEAGPRLAMRVQHTQYKKKGK